MEMYSYVDGIKCETRNYYLLGNLVNAMFHETTNPEAYLENENPNPYDYESDKITLARKALITKKAEDLHFIKEMIEAIAPESFVELAPIDIFPSEHTEPEKQAEAQENQFIYARFLCNYFFPKYYRAAVPPYVLAFATSPTWREVYEQFFAKFSDRTLATFPKYSRLIKFYEAKEAELMNRLESATESLNKFNDTPQEEGDYSTDAHTTTATKATTKTATDYETPMKRLKEIRDNLEDLYNAWAEDYANLFVRL